MKEQLKNLGLAGVLALGGCGNEYFRFDVIDTKGVTAISYRWTPPPESTRGLPAHALFAIHSVGRFERTLSIGGRWENHRFNEKVILAEDELGRKKFRAEHQWDF